MKKIIRKVILWAFDNKPTYSESQTTMNNEGINARTKSVKLDGYVTKERFKKLEQVVSDLLNDTHSNQKVELLIDGKNIAEAITSDENKEITTVERRSIKKPKENMKENTVSFTQSFIFEEEEPRQVQVNITMDYYDWNRLKVQELLEDLSTS